MSSTVSRRQFIALGAGTLAMGASSEAAPIPKSWQNFLFGDNTPQGAFASPQSDQIDLVSHALNRLTYGPRPADYWRVRNLAPTPELAFQRFLEEQLNPESINDQVCDWKVRRLESIGQPIGELFEYKSDFLLKELTQYTLLKATYSERQLYEVMAQFWSDHFNIASSKGECQWLKAADDRDVIRQHALGSFPKLLRASALSPAMLWYLDGRSNQRSTTDEVANENYARELLELHTLGVHGGYTQKDVMEVARCLTGWTVRGMKRFFKGKVEFEPHRHDDGPKEVLGHIIPAGLGAKDLDRVLEIVSLHPQTANYLATKLCRRFISDEPPASAIRSVATSFLDSKGDIKSTLKALFQTPEFLTSRGNRLKRPHRFIVSALRATRADTPISMGLYDYFVRMGQAPFQFPTPDGYPDEPSPWTGTLLWRWSFALNLTLNKIEDTTIKPAQLERDAGGPAHLAASILGRRPSESELESYGQSGNGLALLLSSPAFQLY